MLSPLRLLVFLLGLLAILPSTGAAAHPAPFSYVDLRPGEGSLEGGVTVHVVDLVHDLRIDESTNLLDRGVLDHQYSAIARLLLARLDLRDGNGARLTVKPLALAPVAGDDAVRLTFRAEGKPPAALSVEAHLFDYDPLHQTFVTIYEGNEVAQQMIFSAESRPQTYYAGSVAGVGAVLATFVPAGAHHVLIGPDHVLFILGLILMGGSLRRLTLIVTAFTLGHSVTLALAATGTFAPPAWLIEPLIALSIVVVGLDNLLRKKGERDLRALFAGLFGLIHGFGFAYVLREFGLPQAQLGWALAGFNIGVELGQLAIVVPVALALGWLRGRVPAVANRIAVGGSLAVIAAGVYWFVDRVRNLAG
ncbi:HupE/UreJ family protein [Aurantiacibacter xanthus]|uniref:HupE/UreJ family protein n=1 Tax=Aurantiacibacter xanthus TaxID=1784712 RepID=A0A3A1P6Z3_9SPHN|nr:HupE/UreJ family protein [Aurantiacibacter xanthus]RIV84761.1 HupE/UreJ family protein [Aurantiacibacter xanthus]